MRWRSLGATPLCRPTRSNGAAPSPGMTSGHKNRFLTRVFGYGTDNMAQRETDVLDINTRPAKGDKSTQRERLIAGMIAAACRDGYSGVTVSTVIAHAG